MLKQPDILRSHPTDFIIDGDKLQAPLCVIKGIGASFAHDIIKFMHTDLSDLGLELREPKEVKPKKRKTVETKESENVLY